MTELSCPRCSSIRIKKNGTIHNGKQKYACLSCTRQFILDPQKRYINQETKKLVARLLLERISLSGICRATGVSKSWLQNFIKNLYPSVPEDLSVSLPESETGILIDRIEADELWSFVGNKKNQQWVWIALDITSRQVIAFHVGGRGKRDALILWEKVPPEFQTFGKVYTDLHDAYLDAIPEFQHFPVKKSLARPV